MIILMLSCIELMMEEKLGNVFWNMTFLLIGLIAGWLLPQIGIVIGGGIIAAIIDAFIGAVILLLILRLVRRAA